MTAPIALFAYNRPDHLARTLAALSANELAKESKLYIFCDGPQSPEDNKKTEAVRRIARKAHGFASITVIEATKNKGLAASIISGVTHIIQEYGRVVVVEDDILTSPYFLKYMNDGLEVYAESPEVASIHGWCFPHAIANPPETFFLRGADCWGWATWKRAWDCFEPDAGKLLTELGRCGLMESFDLDGTYGYTDMLKATLEGRVQSWAVRWHASTYLEGMYTLYPGKSLVENIGFDGTGTHCGTSSKKDMEVSMLPVAVLLQRIEDNTAMRHAQIEFYKSSTTTRCKLAVLKAFFHQWFPPALYNILRGLIRKIWAAPVVFWDGEYSDWQQASEVSTGYDQNAIFEKLQGADLAVRDGRALWERDTVIFFREEYNLQLCSAMMIAAAWNKGNLSVLDYGGALGSTYRQHKCLLGKLQNVSWNIVEQPHIVEYGRKKCADSVLQFWDSMDKCLSYVSVDLIIFSSVLQYLEDPYVLLDQAVSYRPEIIAIDRTPFAQHKERITIQHVSDPIYQATYPCRWLDRSRVRQVLGEKYRILPEYPSPFDPSGFYGMIAFRRRK